MQAAQLLQDAAEYVRLNVLSRSGPRPQPPPQIIGRPQKGPLLWRHARRERLLERWLPRDGSWRSGRRPGWLWNSQAALSALAGQRGRGRAGRSANNINDATQPLRSSTSGTCKQRRLRSVAFESSADESHAPPLLLGSTLSQPNFRASFRTLGQLRQSRLPTELDQLVQDIEALLCRTSKNKCCATCQEAWRSYSRSTG